MFLNLDSVILGYILVTCFDDTKPKMNDVMYYIVKFNIIFVAILHGHCV